MTAQILPFPSSETSIAAFGAVLDGLWPDLSDLSARPRLGFARRMVETIDHRLKTAAPDQWTASRVALAVVWRLIAEAELETAAPAATVRP